MQPEKFESEIWNSIQDRPTPNDGQIRKRERGESTTRFIPSQGSILGEMGREEVRCHGALQNQPV